VGVQVCAHAVLVIRDSACLSRWNLSSVVVGDMIIAASHSGPYLLVRLRSRKAVLLRESSGGQAGGPHVQVVQAASAVLQPKHPNEALISACCLYNDISGWLQSSLQLMGCSTTVSAVPVFIAL
jgi:hypothetical protein